MGELEASIDIFPIWKAVIWCFYPMAVLVLIELLSNNMNDDDDDDGGKMIPAFQGIGG